MNVNNDLEKLIENLPFFLQQQLNQHPFKDQLIEIVLDLGRRPEARFTTGPEYLSQKINNPNIKNAKGQLSPIDLDINMPAAHLAVVIEELKNNYQ